MREIEARVFAAGMPVAALMEKVGRLIADRIKSLYPTDKAKRIGILVGPGHNGGDALVVARELHFQGYEVVLYRPLSKLKELTEQHFQYTQHLNIPWVDSMAAFPECGLLIDGLFGFGLERAITDSLASAIEQLNQRSQPIISIDIPSGLHTDTGEVLGTAIRATRTFCLGLWKQAFLQDVALDYLGEAELIDIHLPLADIHAILGEKPTVRRITPEVALNALPLQRSPVTHKYKQGHLLLICGSRRYSGGATLTALGARASGVGMLSIAVPESLKAILTAQLPEALVIGCPETETGAIAELPEAVNLSDYDAIACGPGLTQDAISVVQTALKSDRPLILDADGLNILAQLGTLPTLSQRQGTTILTPHAGEFKRLFPDLGDPNKDRISAVRQASQESNAVVLLKGGRTAIADASGEVAIVPESTPALARGGSGDVLTGLLGGLLATAASRDLPLLDIVSSAAWWHAQAGILAAKERTVLGVDAFTLTQYLIPVLLIANY